MTALGDAILAARQATPNLFTNVSSNYLLGLVQNKTVSPQTFGQIANTNTVVLSNNNAQGGRSSLGIGQSIISAVQNGLPLNLSTLSSPVPGSPTGASTNPTPGNSNPNIVNPDGSLATTTTNVPILKQISDGLKANASSIGVSAGALVVGGFILFLFLRRK